MLIVSDKYNKDLIKMIEGMGSRVICWSDDIPKGRLTSPKHGKLRPIIDMVCCVPAKKFFGTALYTFSTGIMQWRGYMKAYGYPIDDNPVFIKESPHCNSCAGDIEPETWRDISIG